MFNGPSSKKHQQPLYELVQAQKNKPPKFVRYECRSHYVISTRVSHMIGGTWYHTDPRVAARIATACVYFSAFRRIGLIHSAVVSKAYAKKVQPKRSDDASKKLKRRRVNCKQSIFRTKKRSEELFLSSEYRCHKIHRLSQ